MLKTGSRQSLLRLAGASALVGLVMIGVAAHAQSSLGLGNSEPVAGPSGGFIMAYLPWLQPVLSFINAKQQEFYRALTVALKAMRSDPWQMWWLVGLSFAYGVFHAAGPGHGKAVISSYMIANETQLRRGVVISLISALLQGATALLVTGAGFLVLRGTTITMTDAQKWLEVASFGLIVAFGFYLLYRKMRGLFRFRLPGLAPSGPALALAGHQHDHGHHHDHHDHHHRQAHGHDHGHGHDHHGASHGQAHAHSHSHDGEVCEVCGHSHVPSPELVRGEHLSLSDAWAAITAVGLRPCSGALFVLTFSFLNGLYVGGAVSVLAMSLGTAITVSILAILAVTAKDWALRYAGQGSRAMAIGQGIEITGALLVILFGTMLLLASLQL